MSAIRPYGPPSTPLDSREKLEADMSDMLHELVKSARQCCIVAFHWDRSSFIGLLDRQAAITEREVLDRRIKTKPSLVNVYDDGTFEITAEDIAIPTSDAKAKIAELQAKVDDLQARLDMAHETIDGLRASLDETIAERNELQAKLDDFDGDCYCGATVTEWYELATRLQDEADVLKAEIGLHVDEHKKLRSQVELKDDIIEGLRQSLDEIMAERNALVHCLEADHDLKASWDGLRKAWNIEVTDEYIDAWDALSHAFDRACAYIADKMGTCPQDAEDYDRDCGSICHDQLAECWRHYFEHTQHDTVESLLDEFMVALHELGEGADYGPTKERMAERIRKAVER